MSIFPQEPGRETPHHRLCERRWWAVSMAVYLVIASMAATTVIAAVAGLKWVGAAASLCLAAACIFDLACDPPGRAREHQRNAEREAAP